VNKRIQNHSQQKDWWDTFVIFINKDANLTKAHVRFLEKKLYFLSLENKTTIKLTNSSEPTGSKLPKSDIDDMDEYLDNVIFILKNLGIIDFTKTFSDKPISNNHTETIMSQITVLNKNVSFYKLTMTIIFALPI